MRQIKPLKERFEDKVVRDGFTDHHWWTGGTGGNGYGKLYVGPNMSPGWAHVVSYELYVGPTNGLQVLHKCDLGLCVNPDHLFLGTQADNVADMHAKGRDRNGREDQTHCKRGHEFTPDNLWCPNGGKRKCKTCQTEQQRARRAAKLTQHTV